MVLILIKICRFLLWDFVTLPFNIDILFNIALFLTLSILLFKILRLCAEAYLEPSEISKGLIIWIFQARAENFNLVKRVGKKNDIIWSFSFRAVHFSPRAEFPKLFLVPVSEAAVGRCSRKKVFLKVLKIHRKTPMSESLFKSYRPQACSKYRLVKTG